MKLNHIKYKYIFLCLLLLGLTSCKKDFLNQKNPLAISDEEVWSDPALIAMYVNSIYNDVPGWDMGQLFSSISDESMVTYSTDASHTVLRGDWSAVSNPMGYWPYASIRKCNEFFARIDAAPVDNATKTVMKGEVRFLRAFLYYNLTIRYGGVPIILKPQKITDDLQVSRNTLDESFNFIVTQMDSAANELPKDALRGRATKGAALAMKGRTLTFYASPLYNEAHDNERWKAAADANLAVMNLAKYELNPDLKRIWLDGTEGNKEPIFEVCYAIPQKHHYLDAIVKPLIVANNTAGMRNPYQELVNAYPMKNGKLISESGSGYNLNDPYAGRDDRFYNDIAYNGAKIKGTASGPPVREITLQIYKGGRDYDEIPGYQIYNTYTGYYSTKMINQENAVYRAGFGSTQSWLEIRYAEVLLNYAEAQNEYLGSPDATVYEALNKIRKRAGITNDIPAGSLTKESMRTAIANERYVELSYECKRYWDLRRWKTADKVLNGVKFTGVVTTKKPDGSFTYEYKPAVTQSGVFLPKMYFMPLPQSEITKNKKLVQNPGWE